MLTSTGLVGAFITALSADLEEMRSFIYDQFDVIVRASI
jgi:hypothetical protein